MSACLRVPLVAILSCLALSGSASAQDSDKTTTFFIVRHADRAGSEDALTDAGRKRAIDLRDFMVRQNIKAVYSTNTQRTMLTAKPTAQQTGLPITRYEDLGNGRYRPIPTRKWYESLIKKHRGQSVLIVGHSNTIVPIANGLGGEIRHKVSEHEYHSMFIVAVSDGPAQVVRINYGKVPPPAKQGDAPKRKTPQS